MNRAASREVLIEKIGKNSSFDNLFVYDCHFVFVQIETVTIDEPPRRPPYTVSFVRAPSPPVRQLKIRPRPTSCFDLRKETTGLLLIIV